MRMPSAAGVSRGHGGSAIGIIARYSTDSDKLVLESTSDSCWRYAAAGPREKDEPADIMDGVELKTVTARTNRPGSRKILNEPPLFLIVSVRDDEEATAERTIRSLLDQGWYVLGPHAPYRERIVAGTRLCIYVKGRGVVAEASAAGPVEERQIPFARKAGRFPYAFSIGAVRYFFDKPIVIDALLRSRLDAFRNKNPMGRWAHLVQVPRSLTKHDFDILTGHQ